ncbi:CooT family nickel-binding protein [Thermosediminibacter oceani]|uniref:RNA-binding protein, predicted n=1 Tax=Thermosediminibacter oceani (strain ATCC BAA-1034 / DSM 16646 / JW/IW-1228P) TaxID=555079 RepID=D9S2F2_THEOJ|nr:CooT family nickel-binding protein [Thermosediminibacter oceani]ADL07579.1 RNA-binding protein, predicted [Thermosediminibacter oceani DSM 16646]
MCESRAVMLEDGREKELMENVIYLEPRNGSIFLRDFLGREMTVEARIKEIKLLDHEIVLEK